MTTPDIEFALDPVARLQALLARARALDRAVLPEPNAFALGTADADGTVSVRMLLVKSIDHGGLVFFTNYDSRKGRALLAHPQAAMCFHWQPFETQVRVEGRTQPVTREEADAYFASRARGSQVGAWASLQSQAMPEEGALERRVAEVEARYAGQPVPRPPHWSGFRLVPSRFEFWFGQPSRLHVRHVYVREGTAWRRERLFP